VARAVSRSTIRRLDPPVNSRQRVLAAIRHEEPDRVPIDLGGTTATAITVGAYAPLRRHLSLPFDRVKIWELFALAAEVESDVRERFHADAALVYPLAPRFDIPIRDFKPWALPDGTPVLVPAGFEVREDDDRSLVLVVRGEAVAKMPAGGFYFSELANVEVGDLSSFQDPPDPSSVAFSLYTDEDLGFRRENARLLRDTTDLALVVEVIEPIRWCPSIAEWLYALASDPDRTERLMEKKSMALVGKVSQLWDALGTDVDVIAFYQDYGTQRGEMVSPTTFAERIAPQYRRVFDWIHAHTTWKVFFHSCGSIRRIIPSMIEMGVDILNPVQVNTANMDARELKAEFGDRLCFWGGGIDTQTVLPFGTPDDVRAQVRDRVAALGRGGGFVFAASQDVQPDVPPQNIVAMLDEALTSGAYPLQLLDAPSELEVHLG
jgi:uroporphyrinogen decarboxylase